MSVWKEYRLGELGNVITGKTPSSKFPDEFGTDIPFVTPTDFRNYTKSISFAERFLSKKGMDKLSNKILPKNSILVTCIGSDMGKVAINRIPVITNQQINSIVTNEKINYEFLYYKLVDSYETLRMFGQAGTAIPIVNKSDFENLIIKIPENISHQIVIAEILSSLDDKIDLLHRQNKTLEQLAETLFREWFVEEAEENWEEKNLSELLTITSSKRIYYSEYVTFGVPFYRSKEIIELHNSGSTNSELYISNEKFQDIEKKFGAPIKGDILMTSVGTLGVTYRVRNEDKFYFKDGNLTWFKDFKGIPSVIIYLWLNSRIGQEELSAITIGSTQEALTIVGLKNLSLKIPPKDKLKLYEHEFEILITKIDSNQNQIQTLTKLRDTLLPKLMSGEVRVKSI